MAKNCKNQLSGAENRKRAKVKAIKTANVLSKVAKLDAYFNIKNAINGTENTSSINIVDENTCDEKTEIQPVTTNLRINEETTVPNKDPALWKINENTIDYFTLNGFDQNLKNTDFSSSKETIYLLEIFVLVNGESINRTFVLYSESKGCIYCAPCRLFGGPNTTNIFSKFGFFDWKKGEQKLSRHENSLNHKSCILKMKKRGSEIGRIDHQLILQVQTETNYWKEVLTRVVAVVKSLSSRGLAMGGHDDKFGSTYSGNFVMSLELIAEFDPFLKNHISEFGNKGKGTTSYLSFTYLSIIVDSTPDISHTDQLAFIFRYVSNNGEPVERFLKFLANSGHKSKDLADAVFMVLEENEIDINNCRGQSYDNASNMSGVYSGLQARIKEACLHAVYVPCAAHSLNLVGECAADCCIYANEIFNFLQNIYSFFSESTYRWEVLDHCLSKSENVTVKRLSDTQWAARYEACLSLSRNWNEILKALNIFINNPTENSKTKCECKGLLKKMNSLEMGILVSVWNDILERFNIINKKLHNVHIDLTIVITLYKSLINYIMDLRNSFSYYEKLGMEKTGIIEYKFSRTKKRKIPFDESSQGDIKLEDSLHTKLRKRLNSYEKINTSFGFLFNITELSVLEVRQKSGELQKQYSQDLDISFMNECIHFRAYLKDLPEIISTKSVLDLCKIMKDDNLLDIYQYVNIALRMFMCVPASNTSAERSFSTLKRIKSYLRSSMNDDRLNSLAILNIESQLTTELNYDEIIEDFARSKARRKILI
ncbi:zinc finger MYM-type protein 1-like [Aphis gossypii]|uniref:zinc finger MYM-type protein 1-like n=1 Tax=Aphis gossypii TaxID=80765 RepID=UPI0021592C97|nr:zinc finger MYM-type protein 1-like [Aphis gossypii]